MADDGWTRTPNFIYDLMGEMKETELKVVLAIARQTAGWQRDRATLRMIDIEDITKLSRPSVNTGIKAAMERGIVGREPDGETFIYWLIEPTERDNTVKNFNHDAVNEGQEKEADSKNSLPSAVKNLNQQTVKNLNSNKRNINTNKPKEREKGIAADAAPSTPPGADLSKPKQRRSRKAKDPPSSGAPPRKPSEWQDFVGAFCWVCHGHKDVKSLTKEQRGALLSEGKLIYDERYTTGDLKEWYKRIWGHGWQYKKDKSSRPKPADVRSSIAQLRAETPEGFEVPDVPTAHVNGTSKVAGSLAALADYEEIKARHGIST